MHRQVGPGRAKQLRVRRLPGSVGSNVSLPNLSWPGVVEQVGVVVAGMAWMAGVGGVTLGVANLSNGSRDDLIEVGRQLVQLRELLPAVYADDEGILGSTGAALPPMWAGGTVGGRRAVLGRRLGRQVTGACRLGWLVGRQVGLLLGAPLQGDWLLHWVRVHQLQYTDLLGDNFTDLPGGQVGHQLGDQAAVALGLQLAVLHRLLDGGDHRLVPAVLRALQHQVMSVTGRRVVASLVTAGVFKVLFDNILQFKLLAANILGRTENIFTSVAGWRLADPSNFIVFGLQFLQILLFLVFLVNPRVREST